MEWWDDLANSGMTREERIHLDPRSEEYYLRVGGSKTQLVNWSMYVLLLWTLKACMCLFYSRLTAGLPEFEIRVKLGYVLIGITWLATQLCILLGCQPFQASWQIYPEPSNFCQPAISKLNLYTTVVLNITTDIYLMSIPVPMLWKANLVTWRKFSLLIVFCGGVFVMLCGVMRCYIVLNNPTTGALKAGTWACRETFLAVLTTNAPVIYPVFRRNIARITSSIFSHHSSSYDFASLPFPFNKSTLSRPNRCKGRRSVNALPTMTTVTTGSMTEMGDVERPAVKTDDGREHVAAATSESTTMMLGTWATCEVGVVVGDEDGNAGRRGGEGGGIGVEEVGDEEHCWGRGSRDYIMRTPVGGWDATDLKSGEGHVVGYGVGGRSPGGWI
ncbi:Protein of unknown function DUF3129 [Macrophomina phaseolina MS6]|uniref:Rhodopsin domain-containing protein n=1 Tax=Macrophomina phaseolina (strain MS6) TaxID=1126212 RepID=K2R098_MACPH|nr:Protein of unknown function DUF3129 [Macrophomina phaseolina MS6]